MNWSIIRVENGSGSHERERSGYFSNFKSFSGYFDNFRYRQTLDLMACRSISAKPQKEDKRKSKVVCVRVGMNDCSVVLGVISGLVERGEVGAI